MRTKPYWTLFGVARGGCPTRRPPPKGWIRRRGRVRRRAVAGRAVPRAADRRRCGAGGLALRVCPTSTPPPPRPCTPSPGRRCWPRWTRGGPIPARLYREGRRARLLLDAAREAAAEAVGCRPDELVFTPSGTRARAHRHRGGARRAAARRASPDRVRGRTLRRCSMPPRRTRRGGGTVDRGRGGPVRGRVDAGGVRRRPCAPGHRAGLPPVRQPRGGDGAAGRRGGRGVPGGRACRCWWTRRSRWAGGRSEGGWSLLAAQRAQVGRPARGRAARRAQGRAVRAARARRTSGSRGGRPGFENLPAIVAAAASLRAVRAEAAAEAVRLRALVERIRARVPRAGAGRGGGRRSGAAAAAPRHLLLSLCRRGDAAARAGPGGLLRLLRLVLHVQHADAEPCAEGDGRAVARATSGCRCRPGRPEEDVERFLEVLPGVVAGVREKLGAPVAGAAPPPSAAATRWSSTRSASAARSR